MGLLTSVKETVLGDEKVGELDEAREVADGRPDDRRSPIAVVESTGAEGSVDAWSSEADCVVATGRSRADVLVELVEANGGRVKQSELVRLTGWSKATVSRYLSGLEDDGTVDRVPVGRCKVVLLPGETLVEDPLAPDDAEGDPPSDATYPRT